MSNQIRSDDKFCPLCEQENRCEVKSQQGCWCMNTQVPAALLAKVPDNLKGISCVCNSCIARYHQQQTLDASK